MGLPFGRGDRAGAVEQILPIREITASLVDFVCENDETLRAIFLVACWIEIAQI